MGQVATSPLPLGGSPPLQISEVVQKSARWLHNHCRPGGSPQLQLSGQNQKWPTSGPGGYITPAALRVPTSSERGAESEVAQKWATWLHNPCRRGGPHRFRSRGRIRSGTKVGPVATQPLPPWGVPTSSEREAISEVAHKWARWLHNHCRPGGSPPLQSGGQNQTWPTSGPGDYITPAACGVPTASERGAESEVAHKWARWLHVPFRLGSPPLQSGGQNQKWPTSGQGGYITLAAWVVPTASKRGAESEVAHKWARWLHNPYRLGGPHRFRAGGRIRSGPQVGQVAT